MSAFRNPRFCVGILHQVQDLLQEIEWRGGSCPDCGIIYRKRVHEEDCALKHLLELLERKL